MSQEISCVGHWYISNNNGNNDDNGTAMLKLAVLVVKNPTAVYKYISLQPEQYQLTIHLSLDRICLGIISCWDFGSVKH